MVPDPETPVGVDVDVDMSSSHPQSPSEMPTDREIPGGDAADVIATGLALVCDHDGTV